MRRFFSLVGFLLASSAVPALADESHVITLDASGWDDEATLRTALAHELDATLVGPERAAEASGALEARLDAAHKNLAIRWRKLGEPSSRSVPVSGENEARRAAVLIAANLASGEPPSPLPSPPSRPEDERRLDMIQAMVDAHGERPNHVPYALAAIGLGGALVAGSLALHSHDENQNLPFTITAATGVGFALGGVLTLVVAPYMPPDELAHAVSEERAKGGPDALARVEAALHEHAVRERSARRLDAGLSIATGSLFVGGGVALALVHRSEATDLQRVGAAALLVGGAWLTIKGVTRALVPSELERMEKSYETFKGARPAVAIRPLLAPVPGGAAAGIVGAF